MEKKSDLNKKNRIFWFLLKNHDLYQPCCPGQTAVKWLLLFNICMAAAVIVILVISRLNDLTDCSGIEIWFDAAESWEIWHSRISKGMNFAEVICLLINQCCKHIPSV